MAILLQRTANAISDSFLTSAIAKTVKTRFIVADDNLVIYAGTAYSNQKELRFVRNLAEMSSNTLIVKTEIMSNFGTTDIGIFLDDEINPRLLLSTIGTGFVLLRGTAYIGDLIDGVHSIYMNLRNLDNGTSYQRLIEVHEKV